MNEICSMTGFGHGEGSCHGYTFGCDVKSVNHRYCDVRVRLPRELARCEPAVVKRVRQRIGRGRIEVTIRCHGTAGATHDVEANPLLAVRYREALIDVADALGLPPPELSVAAFAAFEGVVELQASVPDEQADEGLFEALDSALDAHARMRAEEGVALAEDIDGHLGTILDRVDELTAQADEQLPRLRERLHERLTALLADTPVDPERVLTEAAIVAERADVAEEIARLRQHVTAFRDSLAAGGRVGRKLDFLAQELLREANTVASKSWDAPVSLLAVEMKSEIERVREQVQNVE